MKGDQSSGSAIDSLEAVEQPMTKKARHPAVPFASIFPVIGSSAPTHQLHIHTALLLL
jgi:hypothetical protein